MSATFAIYPLYNDDEFWISAATSLYARCGPSNSHVKTWYGAGDGNRTHAISLEGWHSTIELHPHKRRNVIAKNHINVSMLDNLTISDNWCQEKWKTFTIFISIDTVKITIALIPLHCPITYPTHRYKHMQSTRFRTMWAVQFIDEASTQTNCAVAITCF